MSPTIIVLALTAIVAILAAGAGMALRAGYQYGREQNKAHYEELLLAEKETNERKLLEVQNQQRDALREARDETARFRATMERENAERRAELQRQERRNQQADQHEHQCGRQPAAPRQVVGEDRPQHRGYLLATG